MINIQRKTCLIENEPKSYFFLIKWFSHYTSKLPIVSSLFRSHSAACPVPCVEPSFGHQRVCSIWRCHLISIENPIVEIRQSYYRLISTMGFPIVVRCHLYIGSGPCVPAGFLTANIARPSTDTILKANFDLLFIWLLIISNNFLLWWHLISWLMLFVSFIFNCFLFCWCVGWKKKHINEDAWAAVRG